MAMDGNDARIFWNTIAPYYSQADSNMVSERYVAIANLRIRRNTTLAAIVACRGIRANVQNVLIDPNAGAIALAFVANGTPNMSELALLGHVLFHSTVSPDNNEARGLRAAYLASIGRAVGESLWNPNNVVAIGGKERRSEAVNKSRALGPPIVERANAVRAAAVEVIPHFFL